jgi:hypothetical protein
MINLFCVTSYFPQTKPLEGTVTAGDTSPEAEFMAYVAISQASSKIAQSVCSSLPAGAGPYKVAIYDTDARTQIIGYQNTLKVLDSIKVRFDAAIPVDNPATVVDESLLGLTRPQLIEAESLAISTGAGGQRAAVPVLGEADNIAAGLKSISGAATALFDLVGLFRTNIEEKGFKLTTVTKEQLVPEVLQRLKTECTGKNIEFYIPKEMPFSVVSGNSTILTRLQTLYDLRTKAASFVDKIEGMRLAFNNRQAKINSLQTALTAAQNGIIAEQDKIDAANIAPVDVKESLKATRQKARHVAEAVRIAGEIPNVQGEAGSFQNAFVANEGVKNNLAAIIKQFDTMLATLLKTDDKNPTPLLLSLFEAENLVTLANSNGQYLLELASNSAGSTRRIKRNLFLDLFIPTGRISYNGVAAIRYTLYKDRAIVENTCVVKTYIDFRRLSKLNNANSSKDALIVNDCLTQ